MIKPLMQSHPGLKIAVAESLTGGRLQARITSESGSSEYFVGGLTAYTLEQKVTLLGVDRTTAEACNCVSAEVARAMARGVCALMKTGIGVATTGYAEPDPAQGVREPKAHWCVCHERADGPMFVDGYAEFHGLDRAAAQDAATEAAFSSLKKYLESL